MSARAVLRFLTVADNLLFASFVALLSVCETFPPLKMKRLLLHKRGGDRVIKLRQTSLYTLTRGAVPFKRPVAKQNGILSPFSVARQKRQLQ
jgi:hypothetical protein